MTAFTIPNSIEFESEITSAEHEQNYTAIESDLNTEVLRRDGSVAVAGGVRITQPAAPVGDDDLVNKLYADSLMPVGVAFPYFGATVPSADWAFPVGQTLSRATYPLLAAAIAPDVTAVYWVDASNFLMPDLRSRVLIGKGTAGYSDTLGESGGSADAVNVSHDHSFTGIVDTSDEVGVGQGFVITGDAGGSDQEWWVNEAASLGDTSRDVSYKASDMNVEGNVVVAGVSGNNANLQPYLVCNHIMRLA